MSKTVIVKLTNAGNRTGPFTIYDDQGNLLGTDVSKISLIDGATYVVADNITSIVIHSEGKCQTVVTARVQELTIEQLAAVTYEPFNTGNLWRHLTNTQLYNNFYGNIDPYIIEYPFSYQYYDEILQNVKDYTKVYKYILIPDGVFNYNNQVQVDNKYFNKRRKDPSFHF